MKALSDVLEQGRIVYLPRCPVELPDEADLDVLRDQLAFMRRCGFDSFEIRADRDASDALASLGDFSHVYQCATVDTGTPLVLRAAQGGSPARARP